METKHEASMARTLRAEQHQNPEDHHNTCDDTNDRVHRTLTYKQFYYALTFSFCVLALLLTGAEKIVRGNYWFESVDTTQARRLADENNRQDNEINMLRHKMGFKNETILIHRGIMQNNSTWLELSRVENKRRPDPFEFVDWNKPDNLVEYMFKNEAWDCVEWVMRQPKWYSCLNNETYAKCLKFNEKLNTKELAEQNTSSLGAFSEEAFDIREAHQRNKLLFMSSVIWDNVDELKRVDLSDLPPNWVEDYPKLVVRLEQINSTNVLKHLDAKRIGIESAEMRKLERIIDDHPLGGSQ